MLGKSIAFFAMCGADQYHTSPGRGLGLGFCSITFTQFTGNEAPYISLQFLSLVQAYIVYLLCGQVNPI
jgi:hypothetical protein